MSPASLLTAVVIAAQSPAPPSPESAGDLTLKQVGCNAATGAKSQPSAGEPAADAGSGDRMGGSPAYLTYAS